MSKLCCSTDNNLNLVKKKEHKHKYDTQGNQLCCVRTEKIYEKAGAADLLKDANQSVRMEAIQTARQLKRHETWNVLIDMLDSVKYGYAAAEGVILFILLNVLAISQFVFFRKKLNYD